MKKYLLLLVVTFMIVIPGVKAEEETKLPFEGMGKAKSSTKNLLKTGIGTAGYNAQWFNISDLDDRTYPCLTNFIKVEPNETYTFSRSRISYALHLYEFDANFKFVSELKDWTFTTNQNTAYFTVCSYGSLNYINSYDVTLQLELGNEATDIVAYEEKKDTPDTPDTPVDPISPTPTPQETDPTKILTNFYSICTSKLKLLSDEFSNNFLLLSMPVIVLLIFVFTIIWRRYII